MEYICVVMLCPSVDLLSLIDEIIKRYIALDLFRLRLSETGRLCCLLMSSLNHNKLPIHLCNTFAIYHLFVVFLQHYLGRVSSQASEYLSIIPKEL